MIPRSAGDRLSALSAEQRALLDELLRRRGRAAAARLPPPVEPLSGPRGLGDWPLSLDQERLWRLHQEDPRLVSWNVDAGSRVRGEMDLAAFLAAIRLLIRRHAAWRTTFPLVDGRPVQRVAADLPPEVSLLDLVELPPERREHEGHRAIYEHTRQPFDLACGPLLRVALVRLAPRDHLFLLTIHHLATDWITFQVFFRELIAAYEALRTGGAPALPALPAQFPDHAVWERRYWSGEVLAAETEHWRHQLEGFPLVLDLPADRPRPPVQSQRGGLCRVAAGGERTDRLRALARGAGATMFMGVLAVVYALLWRLSGRQRLVVGSNSANRMRPEVESVAGFFLTQVPFAADLGGDPTFREVLARARQAALAAYAHQNLPFSQLVEALAGEAAVDRSRHPVIQVMLLVLEVQGAAPGGALEMEPIMFYDGNSRWDLMFGLYDDHRLGLVGALEYNADIFAAPTAARFLDLFYRLVDAVTADPELRLSQLPEPPRLADTAMPAPPGEQLAAGASR